MQEDQPQETKTQKKCPFYNEPCELHKSECKFLTIQRRIVAGVLGTQKEEKAELCTFDAINLSINYMMQNQATMVEMLRQITQSQVIRRVGG